MRRKLRNASLCSASFGTLLFLLSGCGSTSHKTNTPGGNPNGPSNPGTGSSESFSVKSITPASGITGVALNSTIQVTFSGAANPSTVNTTNIQIAGSKPVSGAIGYNSMSNSATFTPSAALAPNTTYSVTVSGVTSSDGTAMASAFKSTFTTAAASSGGGGGGTGGGGGGGTGGGGGSGSGSGTMQYQATLFPVSRNPGSGVVSVDTNGAVAIQMTSAIASTNFTLQFCPAYILYQQQQPPCFTVGNLTTDASGNGSATMQFPQSGSWAGDFQLNSGTKVAYGTDVVPPNDTGGVTEVYTAALQPESTVNGKGLYGGQPAPQGPLTSGSVTYSKGSLVFTLTGASPNTTFVTDESPILGGSSTYQLYNSANQSAFTTDSSGNLTFSVLQDQSDGDFFEALPENGATVGFIGGFSVPKQ